jgi:hypothetical protein
VAVELVLEVRQVMDLAELAEAVMAKEAKLMVQFREMELLILVQAVEVEDQFHLSLETVDLVDQVL